MTRPRYLRDLVVTYKPNPARIASHRDPVTSPDRAASILIPLLRDQPQEIVGALYLDTKAHVIAYREIARGSLSACAVESRDIMTPGLLINADTVIVGHNHPSGDPTPSPADDRLTRLLVDAGQLLNLILRDHLVIGQDTYVSYAQTGRLRLI